MKLFALTLILLLANQMISQVTALDVMEIGAKSTYEVNKYEEDLGVFSQGDSLYALKADDRKVSLFVSDAFSLNLIQQIDLFTLGKRERVLAIKKRSTGFLVLAEDVIEGAVSNFVFTATWFDFEGRVVKASDIVSSKIPLQYLDMKMSVDSNYGALIYRQEASGESKAVTFSVSPSGSTKETFLVSKNGEQEQLIDFIVLKTGELLFLKRVFDTGKAYTPRNQADVNNFHVLISKTDTVSGLLTQKLEQLQSKQLQLNLLEAPHNTYHLLGYKGASRVSMTLNEALEVKDFFAEALEWNQELRLDKVTVLENGQRLLIGEQYSYTEYQVIDADGEFEINYKKEYASVMLSCTDVSGKWLWSITVPKKQEYVSVKPQEETPGMLSFKIMDFKEQLVLVYLDDRRNQKAAVGDYLHTYAAYKPASLVCMLVDTENGQRSKQVLFDTKHLSLGSVTDFSKNKVLKINPKEFVIEMKTVKKRKAALIRVVLQD